MSTETKKYVYDLDLGSDIAPARVAKWVGRGKAVLEVGCASGSQSKVLRESLDCVVTGIEIDPEAATSANRYCERVIVGDIETMALDEYLGDQKFDVVILADVLEHLRDPTAALRKVKPHLASNGYLLASIPNIVHASVILEMIRGNFDYRECGLLDDTHIRFFTKKSVMRLFEASGYIVAQLDRVTASPGSTEFSTEPASAKERNVLEYILSTNPESQTYQFIIKAFKGSDGSEPLGSAALMAQEHIHLLAGKVVQQQKRIEEIESALAWIQTRWPYRLRRYLKKLLHRGTLHQRERE